MVNAEVTMTFADFIAKRIFDEVIGTDNENYTAGVDALTSFASSELEYQIEIINNVMNETYVAQMPELIRAYFTEEPSSDQIVEASIEQITASFTKLVRDYFEKKRPTN